MKRRVNPIFILVIPVLIVIIILILFSTFFFSSERQAKNAIHEFYEYEQSGSFSESWEMLHPFMQEKFAKDDYIEVKPHIFFSHLGVTSFQFKVDGTEKLNDWYMQDGGEPIDEVYRTTVEQDYESRFGNLTISQYVYATEVNGEWRILWNYK